MSAPDDLPSLSRIRKPEESSSSSSSSSDSMSQPSTTPPAEPRPSTSNGHESGHTRSGHSHHEELHSSGQLGNHHSRRPSTGRSSTDSRSSTSGGRSSSHGDNTVRRLSTMRNRVLISNANAIARVMSLNELDDTTTTTTTTTSSSSPSSPHMNGNGHSNTDDDQQQPAGMSNGSRKKKKKKNKQWHRSSDDSDLMGFTGLYPNLSRATNQVLDDGNPGLESQTSDELRALSRRGLMVYPREAQGSEAAAAAASAAPAEPHPQQPQQPPPQSQSLGTSPSPMSSPIESSSLSPNSELNRNLTPGPETGLVVPELEPPTTTSTNRTTTTTTTTASNSPTTTTAAATPRAKSVADADADADAKELQQSQSQSETKTPPKEEQKEQVLAGPSTSGKRQGSPLDKPPAKERKKRRHDKLKESKYDLSPPQSQSQSQSRRHKHGEPSSSSVRSRSRSKSLSSKDLLPMLEKATTSRSKSQETLAKDLLDLSSETVAKEEPPPEPSLEPESPEPDINVKSESASVAKSETTPSSDAVKKPETPSPNAVNPETPSPNAVNPETPSPSAVNPETPNAVKPVTVEEPPLDSPMEDKIESTESSVAAEPEAPSSTSVAEPAAASLSEVKPMLPPNNAATTTSSTTKRKSSKAKRSPKGGHKLNQSKPNEPQEPPAVMGKRVPKPKVPKGASPPSEGWTSTSAVKGKVHHRPSTTNGGNPAGAGASVSRKPRKMSEMSTGKDKKEISEEDAAQMKPQPEPSTPMDVCEVSGGSEEEDNDDAGSSSSSSAMEIAEEVEFPPGQQPPAHLFEEQQAQAQAPAQGQNDPYRELKDMDVVVIGGRKAVFVRGPPERPPMKLVPRQPDLTSYDRIYRKRIQDKRMGQTLAMSVNDAHVGVNVMAAVMRTMNMKERVTMSQVCTSWAMVSRDNRVWNTVILRDTVVKSWHRLLMEMARHRTQELDMRGVTLDAEQRLSEDLRILRPLRILCTDATTNDFLKVVQTCLPRLHELRMTCVSAHLNLTRIEKMRKLRVLRINMTHPKAQIIRLRGLVNLDLLTELVIRGVTNLKESLDLRALKTLRNLRILKLGSCEDLNNQMLGLVVLPCLEDLRTLRIENDHKAMTTVFPVDDILGGVAAAGEVERLELINVDVDSSFGQLLAKCNTVASLLLAPKCLHNTATMINAVMQAVKDNSDHLITFRLVLVTQLLSATENLYKGSQKKPVIPVQRPVPGIPPDDALNRCSPEDNCQEEEHSQCVAFLPVERLEQILNEMMRMGCVSVAKVAMSETTNVQFLERDVSAST